MSDDKNKYSESEVLYSTKDYSLKLIQEPLGVSLTSYGVINNATCVLEYHSSLLPEAYGYMRGLQQDMDTIRGEEATPEEGEDNVIPLTTH